jgi:hypothetical protein
MSRITIAVNTKFDALLMKGKRAWIIASKNQNMNIATVIAAMWDSDKISRRERCTVSPSVC